ncbi:unnamed protein product [Symbiodinium sp. KB8]|nr:unnamed protein product [Symbiodinium sp. KB8]
MDVIIFDWDDTLLCSSAINAQQWRQDQLEQLEQMVESILLTAMHLGETMIVTNGNASWVQDSARRFLPNLQRMLNRVTVMSARAIYEHSFPGDPFAWKRQAFKEILARRRQEGFHPEGVNLIVLGDSPAEIQAARTATKVLCGRSMVKTVKFKETPSVNELLGQLRRVSQELAGIVQEDKSLSRGLVQRGFPGSIDQLSSWASGWRISETESWDAYSRVAATLLVGAQSSGTGRAPLTLALILFQGRKRVCPSPCRKVGLRVPDRLADSFRICGPSKQSSLTRFQPTPRPRPQHSQGGLRTGRRRLSNCLYAGQRCHWSLRDINGNALLAWPIQRVLSRAPNSHTRSCEAYFPQSFDFEPAATSNCGPEPRKSRDPSQPLPQTPPPKPGRQHMAPF